MLFLRFQCSDVALLHQQVLESYTQIAVNIVCTKFYINSVDFLLSSHKDS